MIFEPIYYGERLTRINPEGDVGVVTLWSQVETTLKVMACAGVDLTPETSRIAVVGNLYGNGLPQLLRNLLWNPQLRYVLIVGKDLSGSSGWLRNFFAQGMEETEFLGAPAFRIKGTERVIDGGVRPGDFARRPEFRMLGEIGAEVFPVVLRRYFQDLPEKEKIPPIRLLPVLITEPSITRFPSNPLDHNIVEGTVMEAWAELVFRLVRFGFRNKVAKRTGTEERIELQNVKVVITEPREEAVLQDYGFRLEDSHNYQQSILDPQLPEDLEYTYGNRLREYFGHDSLEIVGRRLKEAPESRHAYISLWDNRRDLANGTGCPCFVSAFFRKFGGKLTLTATFRSHNAMDAWLKNVYGLMAIQGLVAEAAGMEPGAITVISHSISIDPAAADDAKKVATAQKIDPGIRMDPNGSFTVTVDRGADELVVEHALGGMVLGQYRGRTAEGIEKQIVRDCAISSVAHALYLGREMARKEAEMRTQRTK
jgi:thymidylate synthase